MRALPITITADDSRHFNLAIGNGENTQHATGLAWDELLGMVGVLTHPEIRSAPYGISKVRAVAAEEAPCVPRREEPALTTEPLAVIRMTIVQAERLTAAMSELLAWCEGFRAALGDDPTRQPPGIEHAFAARNLIRTALHEARGDESGDLPF
ncbi:hypothetical protein [Methylobacterium nodulans]|uniref:Uncharacterized protein n=1 Tax=Methylobacterium nodulans (strain LMG 21967 / CNCM I-2342 / ORS 2060) TaxID=460265 RepID=B8INY0_METNO|nr:hypothetical protein [Methylobacterium nodulans]ACL58496.1 hypothetical protein Mnod_3587 [Methylobacterium nodulans ORS 2060]